MRTNRLSIRTPEGIVFSLTLAGPVTRCLALLIDFFCISMLTSLVNAALFWLRWVSVSWVGAVIVLSYFVISIGYGIVCEWFWRGQTLGKRLLKLRVMDAQGLRLQPSQIVVRNLLRFVDSLPVFYLVGGVASIASRHSQRLGDLAANTIVVRIPKTTKVDVNPLVAGKFNSLRHHPHLEARLRQYVSPPEATVAVQALLRRDELDPTARVELFTELAGRFREKVEFPSDATEGLSDEQYVRNVVDIIFRDR